MSLINDALKRATRNQQSPPPPAPEPVAPMQPVEQPPRRGLPWYFFPVLLAIMAAACWFIVKGVQARQQSSDPASRPSLVKAREPEPQTPASTDATAPGTQTSPTTPTKASSAASPAPVSNTSTEAGPPATEAPAPQPSAPPEPPKPAYKLQGVFFRPENPSAVVNGKSVWVGSRVDGAIVKTITQNTVTIEVNGQTTVLTLN